MNQEVEHKEEMPVWWRWFSDRAGSMTAKALLALFAFLDSVIIFFPPEIAISALVLARPHRWIFYTVFTTIFTTLGAIVTYIIGAFFFELFGTIILGLVGGFAAFEEIQTMLKANVLWGIIFVGVTPIPWVPFLLASGFIGVNFWVFIAGVVLARLIRFGVVAFLIAHLGPQGMNIVLRTMRIMGTTGIVLTILFVILLSLLFVQFVL